MLLTKILFFVLFCLSVDFATGVTRICKRVNWRINGEDVVGNYKGGVTIVYVLSRAKAHNYYQLEALTVMALYYRVRLRQPLNIVAFQPSFVEDDPVMQSKYYRIKFFKEPRNNFDRVYFKLGGYERNLLIYDRCSRLAYLHGYPRSYLRLGVVAKDVYNEVFADQKKCGLCIIEEPANRYIETRPPITTTTTTTTTTTVRPTTVPTTTTTTTVPPTTVPTTTTTTTTVPPTTVPTTTTTTTTAPPTTTTTTTVPPTTVPTTTTTTMPPTTVIEVATTTLVLPPAAPEFTTESTSDVVVDTPEP